jgi:iron complex transport system ATP-binding protein
MKNQAVEVEDLRYKVGNIQILKGVSFSAAIGEAISIVGPNGAGKTTLLKCLNRILTAHEGTVQIFGRPIESFRQSELAKQVAYVPQAGAGHLPFTVFEFVLLGRYPYLSPFSSVTKEDERAAWDALCTTETETLENRMMSTLSGGECQKVLIAAALAQSAKILLLDEPTTFLDPKHQTEITRILRKANQKKGTTILTVTHHLNSAVILSDRILALKQGQAVFQGVAQEFMSHEILKDIYNQDFDFVKHPVLDRVLAVPRVQT